jgi:hypothetical protein
MRPLLLAAAGLAFLASAIGGVPADARAGGPVPEPVKRAIAARFAATDRFYFPRSLPPGYRYSHWERVERERSPGGRSLGLFRIWFTSPGRAWIEAIRENGRWARWRQARLLAPCRDLYAGGRQTTIAGRRVFYVGGPRRGTAAFCERGYAVELTVNRNRLRPLTLMRTVARAELVER